MGTLAKLPELLLGRLDLVVDVCERLARILLHGAEAWQLRELVLGVADGSLKGSYGPNRGGAAQTLVQRRARVLVDGILLLHPERGVGVRDAVRAALEWRLVPAGRSWIGAHPDDSGSYPDEKPGRWVEITRSVDMTRDPITNAAYERFDPGHADERHTSADQPDAEEHPVVLVSWFEAAAFAAWLGEGARLPDEVVWEHACRAGTVTPYWSGANEADLAAVGWYKKNSRGRTHAVDDLPPRGRQHPFGLRHLHGNVREWTASWWTSDHAGLGAQHDPELPPDRPPAGRRVIRGGTWWNVPRDCRSAYRDGWRPSDRFDDLGFRLVRLPASCTAIDR
jgi:formylglycine-generating enzyme required for sulfatase activity